MNEDVPASELSGRRLDAAVAEEVMGWYAEYRAEDQEWWTDQDGEKLYRQEDWRPSTDMSDAWLLQEKLREKGWHLSIESRVAVVGEADRASGPPWEAVFSRSEDDTKVREIGEMAPAIMARAALRVARKEENS